MSLPTDLEIKSYLRISTDVEDILIFGLNQTARAQVTQYLRVPLESEARTFRGRKPVPGDRGERFERLEIPVVPCDTTATITDVEGATVDSDTYTIDGRKGQVNLVVNEVFDNGPYTVAVNVGWPYHPTYDTDVDPILRQSILDLASDLWSRRNPGAIYEQSGGQVSITYTDAAIPSRTKALLDVLRTPGRLW
jgi:hypothetical protein